MSLLDLKKSKAKNTNADERNVTVDAFIQDAENYAQGRPTLVNPNVVINKQSVEAAIGLAKEQKKKKTFKHVTYTFSEQSIDQINQISRNLSVNKSRLVRILINQFDALSDEEKKAVVEKDQTP